MATVTKRRNLWFAQVRHKGHKPVGKSFPAQGLRSNGRKIQRETDASDYCDGLNINSITVGELVDRYTCGMVAIKSFGAIWRLPVDLRAVTDARPHLNYTGVLLESRERNRRPSVDEITRICNFFSAKGSRQRLLMSEMIRYAVATSTRLGESSACDGRT